MGTTALSKRGVAPARLTDKQRLFIAEYLIDMNGSRAAIAAGYSRKAAKVTAAKLLKHSLVSKAIGKAQRETLEKLDIDRDVILRELAYVALRDPVDLCDEDGFIRFDDLRKLPPRIRRCIDGIKIRQHTDAKGNVTQTIELKLAPKTPAIELAMKHFGMFAPEAQKVKYSLDWDTLLGRDEDAVDPIEARIEQEGRDVPQPRT